MDDLRLLSDLRSDIREPDPTRLARLEDRWTATTRVGRSPLPRVRWPVTAPAAPTRWPGLARRLALTGLLLILAVGAIAGGAVGLRSDEQRIGQWQDGASPEDPKPAAFLLAAASTVERNASADPRPDQWMYSKAIYTGLSLDLSKSVSVARTTEYWIKMDGTRLATTWPTGKLRILREEEHERDEDPAKRTPLEILRDLRAMPTDPDALLRLAYAQADEPAGRYRDFQAFGYLTSLLVNREAPVPPRLTAAAYRALALVPGVRLTAGVADAAGRRGTGLSVEVVNGLRSELIVNSETGAYLGHRNLMPDGSERNNAAFLAYAVVDQAGDRS